MDALRDNGYVVFPDMVTAEMLDRLKSGLDLPAMDAGHIQIRRGDLLVRGRIYGEALAYSPIVDFVNAFLGTQRAVCATWSSNTLYPSTEPFTPHWHVDYPYHDMTAPWAPTPVSAQVLWCLDDFRTDNGATLVIPCGHREGTFPTASAMSREPFVLEAKKGSIVIAHGAWWHSQGVNRSNAPRTCLLGTFVQPWIAPKDDMLSQYALLDDAEQAIVRHVMPSYRV